MTAGRGHASRIYFARPRIETRGMVQSRVAFRWPNFVGNGLRAVPDQAERHGVRSLQLLARRAHTRIGRHDFRGKRRPKCHTGKNRVSGSERCGVGFVRPGTAQCPFPTGTAESRPMFAGQWTKIPEKA
jgi:hypothetical protein